MFGTGLECDASARCPRYWLNPENPSAWGFGDSVMDRYLPYTDVAEECRNLRQLSKVVDGLLL